jgi:two-component system, chemotaxis family, chemotaxis protein CheY
MRYGILGYEDMRIGQSFWEAIGKDKRMKILIIEDDPVCSLVLSKCLEAVGAIQTAVDGEAGLDAVRSALQKESPFDLICLDIMMPKLDGQAVLKGIRALEVQRGVIAGRQAKVIMTTALSDQQNLLEAIQGCDAYLTKPINRADLMFYVKRFGFLDGPAA